MTHPEISIPHFVPSPSQFRAARAVLGWPEDVATAHAGISVEKLRSLEANPRGGDGLFQLEHAYRLAGVEFQRSGGLDGITDGICWGTRRPVAPAGAQSPPASPNENDNEMAHAAKTVNT